MERGSCGRRDYSAADGQVGQSRTPGGISSVLEAWAGDGQEGCGSRRILSMLSWECRSGAQEQDPRGQLGSCHHTRGIKATGSVESG